MTKKPLKPSDLARPAPRPSDVSASLRRIERLCERFRSDYVVAYDKAHRGAGSGEPSSIPAYQSDPTQNLATEDARRIYERRKLVDISERIGQAETELLNCVVLFKTLVGSPLNENDQPMRAGRIAASVTDGELRESIERKRRRERDIKPVVGDWVIP